MADDAQLELYAAELEKVRQTMLLGFKAGGVDPDSDGGKEVWSQVEVGFRMGWDARENTMPAPSFVGAAPGPAKPPPRTVRSLKARDVVWVSPYALIEHNATGAIYLDPLFDVREAATKDYCIRITVEEDGVIARGPVDLHRQSNDKPGKPGMRMVKRFERVDG